MAALRGQVEETGQELLATKQSLREVEAESMKLAQQVQSLQEETAQLTAARTALQEEVKGLHSQIGQLNEIGAAAQQLIDKLQNRIENDNKERAELSENFDERAKESRQLLSEKQQLDQQLSALQQKYAGKDTAQEAEISRLNFAIGKKQQEINIVTDDFQRFRKSTTALQHEQSSENCSGEMRMLTFAAKFAAPLCVLAAG